MKILLCCLLLASLAQIDQATNKSTQAFRMIPIPKKETGYNNFASIAFTSKNDLDSFLKETTTQMGWNQRQVFEDALRNANVDFSKEALVLLRHTEGSGTVRVTFETPVLHGRNLVCEIRGKAIPPGYGATADMAYYCFALVVSKDQVDQVELQATQGGFSTRRLAPIVLRIRS